MLYSKKALNLFGAFYTDYSFFLLIFYRLLTSEALALAAYCLFAKRPYNNVLLSQKIDNANCLFEYDAPALPHAESAAYTHDHYPQLTQYGLRYFHLT